MKHLPRYGRDEPSGGPQTRGHKRSKAQCAARTQWLRVSLASSGCDRAKNYKSSINQNKKDIQKKPVGDLEKSVIQVARSSRRQDQQRTGKPQGRTRVAWSGGSLASGSAPATTAERLSFSVSVIVCRDHRSLKKGKEHSRSLFTE